MDGDCELGGSSGVVAEEGSSGAPAAQEDEPMETTPSSPAQDDTPTADDATGDVTTGDVTKDNDTAATEASNSDNGTGSTTETEGVGAVPKATTPPRSSTEENDDDVVLVEEERNHAPSGDKDSSSGGGVAAATKASTDCTEPVGMATADGTTAAANATTTASSSSSSSSADASPAAASDADATASSVAPAPGAKPHTEPIVIDDEEEAEHRAAASSSSSSSQQPATLASTEPDSEIKIASVTTLGAESSSSSSSSSSASVSEGASAVAAATASVVSPLATSAQGDMNLMITSVTSLQGQGGGGEGGLAATGVEGSSSEQQEEIGAAAENGLQISSTFSLNPDAQQNQNQGQSRPSPTFNPGRVGTTAASQPVQNGETGTHQRPDSWISQSASFPRNQKQPGVDSPSPAASLAKPPGQSGQSGSQQPPRTVKVTCANCKKPLKKGQTAYQRKGSSHLFCSTPCLSAFSHKPQPKKHCTMCKKDITSMKGTIVAQVDSSESFQEFCSTGCLAAYENKQATPKSSIKTKCTVCGKLTEIRHEVSFKNVTHKICSDACFNRYRMANGLVMNCCEQCGNYLPSRATAHHYLQVEGQQKRFCSPACIRDYKQAHGKMTACTGCKVLCRSFDVTQCIGPTGAMEPYCSTACMNKTKAASVQQNVEPSCHFCKRNALPQYQATMPEGKVLNFCSSHCVTKFQSAAVQTTNGQTAVSAPNSNIQLKCNYCRGAFSLKPETLEWENKVYQFCSKACCEDYKKLHCIVAFCENCHEEKTLHETAKISGVSRPFCGEGCKLLFKQSFARRLGLKCVTCNHCEQMCKRSVTRQIDNVTRDFCSEPCAKKFHDWYYKAARCDCCKVQGNLTESVQWRAEMKHFCDQQCLLRFYLQQNEPNMNTQKGPENTALGIAVQTQGTKVTLINQAPVAYAGGGILKDVKNKAVLCKPLTMTKATYCKPHMQSKQLQTDEAGTDLLVKKEYVPVPIPVPVYVPVPMNLYAQATPAPVTLPIPVPVPVFLPTTLQSADEIVAAIKELKAKLPPDILATLDTKPDLIEVKSEEDSLGAGPQVKRERVKSESSSDGDGSSSSSSSDEEEEDKRKDEEEEEEDKYEADLDLENDFPLASEPVPVVEGLDAELNFTLPPVLAEEKDETSRPRPKQKGAKRQAVGGEGSSAPGSPGVGDSDSDPLQPRYGLNAWRRWASSTKQEADALTHTPDTANAKRGLHVKTNLLSMKAGRLGQALSRFVREVRRPNGERYTPDSILYLCLGIQKYLQDKGRTDDLFSDACYSQFGEELNKILKDWQPSVLPDGSLWGRVQERCLWDSGHLGESSPVRLLRSLVYLNTKYFGLRTVEQHLRLSFANVYGPSSTDPVTNKPSIRIRIPSIQQDDNQVQPGSKRKRQQNDLDPDDGSGGAGRCPVKKHECQLYEAYLSKCPVSVRKRADMFYMQPEASGVAGSDASPWFGSTPLDRVTLEMLLTRVLLVRDIYEENHPEEEEEGEAMEEEAQKDPDSGRG